MKIVWIQGDSPFPAADTAMDEPDGLLAAGGDLSVPRLTEAYSRGIFPWFNEGEPILWWSPNPRMVLECDRFSPGRALGKRLRQLARAEAATGLAGAPAVSTPREVRDHPAFAPTAWEVRVDTAFDQVIDACAESRRGAPGTWITPAMRQAYKDWHRAGVAHSIETWVDGQLGGGLYGISLGKAFFGESMFTRVTDSSKIALAYLVAFLRRQGVPWIDCQQNTTHLASLGAAPVPRAAFLAKVARAVTQAPVHWAPGRLDGHGVLHPVTVQSPPLGL